MRLRARFVWRCGHVLSVLIALAVGTESAWAGPILITDSSMIRVSATACTDIQTGCTFEDRSTSAPTSPLFPTVTDSASETQIGSDGQAQSYLQSSFGPGPSPDQTIITANGTGRYFASTEDGEGASAEAGFLSLFDVVFQLETSYSYSLSLDLLASGSPTLVEFCFGPVAGGCLESLALGSPYPNGSSLSINVNGVLGAGDYRLVLQALGGVSMGLRSCRMAAPSLATALLISIST